LQGKGIQDLLEVEIGDGRIAAEGYSIGFGPGQRQLVARVDTASPPIFPKISFATNDSWALVSVVSEDAGFPMLLMNRYGEGVLYVLAIPDNPRHLYRLPEAVITVLKHVVMKGFFVRLDGPSQVALYAYDNRTFIVQSFLDTEVAVTASVAPPNARLLDLANGEALNGRTRELAKNDCGQLDDARVNFDIRLMPHSYRAFAAEK
jgi:hypothetical protein